jgi:phage terminase small subunit
VDKYLVDLDATRAAKVVGYSEKSAHAMRSENLTKPTVKINHLIPGKRANPEKREELLTCLPG